MDIVLAAKRVAQQNLHQVGHSEEMPKEAGPRVADSVIRTISKGLGRFSPPSFMLGIRPVLTHLGNMVRLADDIGALLSVLSVLFRVG